MQICKCHNVKPHRSCIMNYSIFLNFLKFKYYISPQSSSQHGVEQVTDIPHHWSSYRLGQHTDTGEHCWINYKTLMFPGNQCSCQFTIFARNFNIQIETKKKVIHRTDSSKSKSNTKWLYMVAPCQS